MRMVKAALIALVLTVLFCHPGRSQQEEVIREEVRVTNIEVPVRVYHRGKPVKNLIRDDFQLFEGNIRQTINGFFEKQRKIEAAPAAQTTADTAPSLPSPRLFVLVFHLNRYDSELKKGVLYLLEKVIRERDQVLVFVNNRTIFLNNLSPEKRFAKLEELLIHEGIDAGQRLNAYFTRIEQDIHTTRTELEMRGQSEVDVPITTQPEQAIHFLRDYLRTWRDYKRRFLLPDIDRYYRFADFLAKVNLEKWVINFYQVEVFPKLKANGPLRQQIESLMNGMISTDGEGIQYGRMIMNLLIEIDKELNAAQEFDAREISKFFYKSNATCHSILSWTRRESGSRDLEFAEISTDIENSLREITAKTGGELIASNDLEGALDTIVKTEDVYYMLTYEPADPQHTGKIRVEVNRRNHRVVYDNNLRADYIKKYVSKKKSEIPVIDINSISFKEKSLSLAIGNYLVKQHGSGKGGRVCVRVRILDQLDKTVYDKSKYFVPTDPSIRISIDFKWLRMGKYNLFVNATDMLTGEKSEDFLQPSIL